MAINATELYIEMVSAIKHGPSLRTATDPTSPCQYTIVEAPPGQSFVLWSTEHNLAACVPIDLRKAKALVLHLFANTELATPMIVLPNVETNLSKVMDRLYWRGAYGPIVMPQIAKCITLLRSHPSTRRAVVHVSDGRPHDVNRPACVSFLQFMVYREELYLIATQRSLRLDMMPYDCVILTELLHYVSRSTGIASGRLHWYVGSLHATNTDNWDAFNAYCERNVGVHVDTNTPWDDLCKLLA